MDAYQAGLAGKKPEVRKFTQHDDELFAIVKIEIAALAALKIGDPFELVRLNAVGVEVRVARLVVHQAPEVEKKTVFLRVVQGLSEDAGALCQLARSEDLSVPKGFEIRLRCDPERYQGIEFQNLDVALRSLLEDLSQRERARHD